MKGVALSAGHYPAAPGACNRYHDCEHQEALYWVSRLRRHLTRRGCLVESVTPAPLPQKVRQINKAEGIALAVEIHFNACGNCEASGSETLYYPGSKRGLWSAVLMQATLVEGMGGPDRGSKEGWYRQDRPGWVDYAGDVEGDERPLYFLQKTRMTALILEPEFIHNMGVIRQKRDITIPLIADTIELILVGLEER